MGNNESRYVTAEGHYGNLNERSTVMENNNSQNETSLVETGDYITTAYGSLNYYRCTACGYEEILDADNFCPHCGRKIIDG